MFNRKRRCQNPDCRIIYDPISPHSECCCKRCRNRKNYLLRQAKKFLLLDTPGKKWIYAVLLSFIHRRKILTTFDELVIEYDININEFPAPISIKIGEDPSTYVFGDIKLAVLENNKLKVII